MCYRLSEPAVFAAAAAAAAASLSGVCSGSCNKVVTSTCRLVVVAVARPPDCC